MSDKINFLIKKPIIPRIIYLLLLIASAVLVSNIGGVITYGLFFSILLYLPFTIIYLYICRMCVTSHQELDTVYLRKQQKSKFTLILENPGFLPIGSLSLLIPPNVFSFGKELIETEYSLMPKQKITIHTDICCKYAGSYGVGIYRLMLKDPFGIVVFRFDISQGTILVHVKPDLTTIAFKPLEKALSDDNSRMRKQIQSTSFDTLGNDMQKYRPFDPISKIHWKNYARTNELYVRIPDHQNLQMPVIILENNDFVVEETVMQKRDRFLEFAVSAADYFARQKKPVKIIYYNFKPTYHLIDGYESFNNFYSDLTRHLPSHNTDEVNSLLYKAADPQNSIVLIISETDCKINLDQAKR
ncbi:MAG: DUF58 domain-containing protein [Lachnospiraceae bacterium]|nr:DUF58 domain-containing protein [Lachnospiraceae bacterium]